MLALAALAACAANAPQDALAPVGENARQADALFKKVFWLTVVPIFTIVEGLLVFAVIKFRRRPEKDAPVQTHGNTRLEIAWTVVPAVILAVVAVPVLSQISDFARRPTGDVLDVTVVGHPWWWEFRYPELGAGGDDLVTANELHIPTGRPVYLSLTTKGAIEEVIHSFWVPKLSGKQDVVPTRENTMTIRADEPGVYLGQCAEYCGLSHANMRFRVVVQSPEDFEAWAEAQAEPAEEPTESLARKGSELFETGVFAGNQSCGGCHTVDGTSAAGRVGPDLTHFASRETFAGSTLTNPDDLEQWLRNPPEAKPGSIMPDLELSSDEIQALVAYLRSLR